MATKCRSAQEPRCPSKKRHASRRKKLSFISLSLSLFSSRQGRRSRTRVGRDGRATGFISIRNLFFFLPFVFFWVLSRTKNTRVQSMCMGLYGVCIGFPAKPRASTVCFAEPRCEMMLCRAPGRLAGMQRSGRSMRLYTGQWFT